MEGSSISISRSIYVLLSIVAAGAKAAVPARPLLARNTISSGLSTSSPNAIRTRRSSSSASPMAGKCIDSAEGGSKAFRWVVVKTLKNVDGEVLVGGREVGALPGNKVVSTSSISSSSISILLSA